MAALLCQSTPSTGSIFDRMLCPKPFKQPVQALCPSKLSQEGSDSRDTPFPVASRVTLLRACAGQEQLSTD
eukprot:5795178-Prymnesium_polylepis.1